MAADYAGAVAAARTLFVAAWAGRTPVGFVNEPIPANTLENGKPRPFVMLEFVHVPDSYVVAYGTRGQRQIVYPGIIKGHVFCGRLTGSAEGLGLALAIGEIFRDLQFYDAVTPGCFARSGYTMDGQPRISEGDMTSDDGKWFTVSCAIPWEYWHRA